MSTRSLVIVWNVALLVAAGLLWLVIAHDRGGDLITSAAFATIVALSFVASGLIALSRRPSNRVGTLLTATGFLWFVGVLAKTDEPWLFTLGVTFGVVGFGTIAHLFLSFPTGRLRTRLDRALVATVWVAVTAAPVA